MTDQATKLIAALAKAHAAMRDASLNKENTYFGSKYADWSSVRKATMKHLTDNDLAILQFTRLDDGKLTLVSRLMHTSGETMDCVYPLPNVPEQPQVLASAITYAKRVCWSLICAVAAAEDDDGNLAQTASGKRLTGPDEPVTGRLTKTNLDKKLREFSEALSVVPDIDALYGLEHSYSAVIEQGKRDRPSWMTTKQGSDALGILDRIEEKRRELLQKEEAENA